jgi:hypothetical protein
VKGEPALSVDGWLVDPDVALALRPEFAAYFPIAPYFVG